MKDPVIHVLIGNTRSIQLCLESHDRIVALDLECDVMVKAAPREKVIGFEKRSMLKKRQRIPVRHFKKGMAVSRSIAQKRIL
ncbi:MAG TPA: hypothetical protein VGO37_05945 [Steroidobacteraceae bacterium]|nr:hypothetical protein [Steroidobacteraceae bacterium]